MCWCGACCLCTLCAYCDRCPANVFRLHTVLSPGRALGLSGWGRALQPLAVAVLCSQEEPGPCPAVPSGPGPCPAVRTVAVPCGPLGGWAAPCFPGPVPCTAALLELTPGRGILEPAHLLMVESVESAILDRLILRYERLFE